MGEVFDKVKFELLVQLYIGSCDGVCYSSGISYSVDEAERSATMSRIETKKSKEKKSYLSAVPASSEELLEGQCL